MVHSQRFSIVFRVFLPCLIFLLVNATPVPWTIQQALESARLEQLENRPQRAADNLKQVIGIEPWRSELWEQVGALMMRAGKLDEAARAFQEALSLGTLSPHGQFQLGEVFQKRGDPTTALETWLAMLQQSGAPTDVYERVVLTQRLLGDLNGAQQTLSSWVSDHPQDSKAFYWLGSILAVHQPEEAVQVLEQAATLDRKLAPLVETLKSAILQTIDNKDRSYQLLVVGRALGAVGQWDLAVVAINEVTHLAPNYAEAWAFLGEARQQLGQDGSIELRRAWSLNPESVIVQALNSLHWQRQGKPEVALAYLYAAAAAEPERAFWQVEIGKILVEMGNLPAAYTHYQKAVDLEPNLSYYWQRLAEFCANYHVEIRTAGLPAARQALILSPDDAQALDMMGLVLLTLDDRTSAERFLQRALVLDDGYALAHLHLGQLYLAEGNRDQALFQVTQAAQLAEKDEAVRILAQRLISQIIETSN